MIKIKTDSFKIKDVMKRGVMVFGVISVSLCIYTIPFALVSDYVVTKKGVKKRYVTVFFTALIFVCCLYVHISDYSAADFIKPYFRYKENLLLLDPVRLIIASAYNIVFLFHGKLVSEGMEEWSVQEKQKQIEDMLPKGVFNYQNRMHMLVYGSTGAGKGVFLDHLIRYNVENGHFLVFISAKLASTDKYSQLEYCRKMGRLYNIPVYVVSMDATVSDRVQYNPFRFIDEQEMMNALDRFDEALKETPLVRKDLGYPPLVTPTSQLVGTQAVQNVLAGERYKNVGAEIKAYCRGEYGKTPAPIDPDIQKKILNGEEPLQVRYADTLPTDTFEKTEKKLGDTAKCEEDVLSYIAFPQVAENFFEKRREQEEKKVRYSITEIPED